MFAINFNQKFKTKLSNFLNSFEDKSGMKYKKYNLEFFGLCKKCKKT